MDYARLRTLRRMHPGWRLLAADHAPLVVGFLQWCFIVPNVRSLRETELASRLDDFLFELREQTEPDAFPKPAREYLLDWAGDDRGWLRRYYPVDSDEPYYDLTPATEKAVRWLTSLQQQQFVGAESRLMTVFDLLRQIVQGTETDPDVRVAELEKRKAAIDAEIREIRAGRMAFMDDTRLRERFLQMAETAHTLLADFRQVEQNFRHLDRQVREQVATWEGSKGAVLEDIFGEKDAIAESDQGRSFHAFWDFLMSPARQEELTELLERIFSLEPVRNLEPDRRLLRVHYDWLEAGEQTQRTVARLSEQLRRYLDDQAWLENRRIMSLIRDVEQHALAVRDQAPDSLGMAVDEPAPRVELAMERPLFSPPVKPHIQQQTLTEGGGDVDAEALFEQIYVDKVALQSRIRQSLQTREQISLADLLVEHPLEHGLAELVAYLSLAADDSRAAIDDDHVETVAWTDIDGRQRRANVPTVIFTR